MGRERASDFLRRNGIDGIRYPTESLGRKAIKKDGPFNYVVFDENAITIDKVKSF